MGMMGVMLALTAMAFTLPKMKPRLGPYLPCTNCPPPVATTNFVLEWYYTGMVTEVWGTTNLVDWYWKTNVPTIVRCVIENNGSQEFFICRQSNCFNQEVSGWNLK